MAQIDQEQQDRLAKLKQHPNWWSFTDAQRVFLAAMAEGLEPLQAAKRAYPDCKGPVVMVKSLFARMGIQSALETIGLDPSRANITKTEALKHLSKFMRNAKDATEYCKLLAQYSKLMGWAATESSDDSPEVSLDDLVTAMEKKRKG